MKTAEDKRHHSKRGINNVHHTNKQKQDTGMKETESTRRPGRVVGLPKSPTPHPSAQCGETTINDKTKDQRAPHVSPGPTRPLMYQPSFVVTPILRHLYL